MRGTRSEMRHVDYQHTSYRGDWIEAHTNSAHRSHHLETNNVGDIDQSCGHKLSWSNIGKADTTLPNRGRVNFNYGRFSSEFDGSSCYGRIHGEIVNTRSLATAIGHKTPNTIDEKCLQTDASSQVRICSAQDTLPGAHAPGTSLPLCLSGVRFHDHADGTTGARNQLANITSISSTTCDAVGNAAHNIDQTELKFNRSPGEESKVSSDRRRTDSYLADESDTNVDASLSSGVTSALSRAMLLLRRTADDTMEAAIRSTDVPPLKPSVSHQSSFRLGQAFTPTETRSSQGCVPSRSNLNPDVTADNTAFRRTDDYNVCQFDRVAEMRNPSVDARMKPRQRSPSSSANGCHLVRSESSIDQHCSVERQITDLRRTIYNAPVRRDSLSDSHSSSSTITPDNVVTQPSD